MVSSVYRIRICTSELVKNSSNVPHEPRKFHLKASGSRTIGKTEKLYVIIVQTVDGRNPKQLPGM